MERNTIKFLLHNSYILKNNESVDSQEYCCVAI